MSKKQIPNTAKSKIQASKGNASFGSAKLDATHRLKISLGLIIAVFAFLLYCQSIGYFYTLDDNAAITNNKVTTQGISGIPTIFMHNYWYGINDTKGAEYRPLSMIVLAIEWQFIPHNPHLNRLVNVIMYSLSCWLLFRLLCRLFQKHNLVIPFVATLLYAAHPIHTEVVDSIKSLDDILCFLFLILASIFIIRSTEKNTLSNLILTGVFYLLALLSKETAVSFLLILPLILFVFSDTKLKNIGIAFAVLLVFVGIFFFLRYLALESIIGAQDTSIYSNALFAAKDYISRQATAFYILLRYIFLLIFPHPLSHDYSYNQIPIHSITDPFSIAGILLYVAIGAYAIISIGKKDFMAFAILLYLITLAPVANVFRLIGATMAERFLYIPSLGYCLVLTLILVKFSNAEIMKSKASTLKYFFSNNSKLFVLVLGIVCLYSLKTLARIPDWKNNTALFSADAATVPKSARAHIHYAITLFEDEYPKEKNEITKNQILDKSIEEFKKGLDIYPDYQLTYEGLGEAYMKKSDYYNAINYFELSVSKFDEGKSRAFRFLVTCYENTNQWDKQITANDSVLKYEPQDVNAYVNKGTVFGKKGNYNDAIICFEKALSINSNEVAAYKDLGAAYGYLKNYPKAIEYLNKAASLDATDSQIPAFIGLTYKNMGDSIKAKSFFDKAAMMNNKK